MMFLSPHGFPSPVELYANRDLPHPNSPIILTGVAQNLSLVPYKWNGRIVSTAHILDCAKTQMQDELKRRAIFQPLLPNVGHVISVPGGGPLTLMPCNLSTFNPNIIIYHIRNGYMSNLIVGELDYGMNCFSTIVSLMEALKAGIDVLFIDALALKPNATAEDIELHPTEDNLRILTYLVRPRKVICVHGTHIPDDFTQLCRPPDDEIGLDQGGSK